MTSVTTCYSFCRYCLSTLFSLAMQRLISGFPYRHRSTITSFHLFVSVRGENNRGKQSLNVLNVQHTSNNNTSVKYLATSDKRVLIKSKRMQFALSARMRLVFTAICSNQQMSIAMMKKKSPFYVKYNKGS